MQNAVQSAKCDGFGWGVFTQNGSTHFFCLALFFAGTCSPFFAYKDRLSKVLAYQSTFFQFLDNKNSGEARHWVQSVSVRIPLSVCWPRKMMHVWTWDSFKLPKTTIFPCKTTIFPDKTTIFHLWHLFLIVPEELWQRLGSLAEEMCLGPRWWVKGHSGSFHRKTIRKMVI